MEIDLMSKLQRLCRKYGLHGILLDATQCENGHINDTYRVRLQNDEGSIKEYIFQKINSYVFKDPVKVMENIKSITLHLRSKKSDGDCDIITFFDNEEGKNFTLLDGEYWRVCRYVENSVAFNKVTNPKMLFSAGAAFGRFQAMLSDMPIDRLYETIPDFHNTKKRMMYFFQILNEDPLNRAKEVTDEIRFFEENVELACMLTNMLERGDLPLRVVHNDTKYNNILMDERTLEPLCVIDLDTVMPGLSLHDFGDAIRFSANTGTEDEVDLSKVGLNLSFYKEFARGYIQQGKGFLTDNELANMALGAVTITIELASRFLADHINGDKYFRIHRTNHNLERARCQIKLAKDMLNKFDEMNNIINESLTLNGQY